MSQTTGAARGGQIPFRIVVRILLGVSFALLTQFMLGMVVNLFITISKTHPGAGAGDFFVGASESLGWAVTSEWPFLALHALLGLGLVVLSLTFFLRGLLARPRGPIVWGGIGALGGLLAAGNGIYFLIFPTADTASMLMATGFAVSLGSVIIQIFLAGRAAQAAAQLQKGP